MSFTGGKFIFQVFVVMVTLLTAAIVCIAYWIGLPYWWNKSPPMTVILLIIGNWLLANVCFHYYKGVNVPAGYPPQGGLIPEAVSICKKCIKPKPPRTHHCSICNKCVLKMDHHCRILNISQNFHKILLKKGKTIIFCCNFLSTKMQLGWTIAWDISITDISGSIWHSLC